ncbi:TPA: sulfite exporter TauE/SafE family protein [Pseudomonas aeruginosa]|nr:sulfite exporter TauE/SafE family protein [Pseudomonas aeruginosa]HBO2549569.1 sulfite exporter TauE/SafE family protein [Pseudomonas aeruginosa]HBO2581241.1 sulfite exporter TauE/SafE family protein [Pseudomonas aeruginosa]HBO2600050.1 sulfite exporter TauE/SafE family protein [Pseudomonas aeruginosa]HBO5586832.1 sulfite exporter TauE/SafE family protein [Pseudomonas aeruginosa]
MEPAVIIEQPTLLSSLCVFFAAIVRGLTGFGFAAVSVVGLILLMPLQQAVPLILCLEIASSALLIGSAWREADQPLLRRLLLAALLGVPCGLLLLSGSDPHWLTLGVYLLVGALALISLARISLPLGRDPISLGLVGGVSGALIATFSIGGPLLVACLSQLRLSPVALRATLILFFCVVDLAALAGLGLNGNVSWNTASQAVFLLPALGLGLLLGQRLFRHIAPHTAALLTQWLLLTLASLGLLGWWTS